MGGRLRKDGQPDMRYKSNRESASSNHVARKSAVTSETLTSSDDDSYDRNAPGPLRKDGQPNMRYAVNRKYVAEREANKVAENKKTAEDFNKMEAVKGKVKFGLVNARSLIKKEKKEKLEHLIVQSKLNVVAVTETWFANDSELNDACPKGFQALHKLNIVTGRGGVRRGGVAIFCRDNIDITSPNYHKSYNSFEYLNVSIAIGSSEKIRIITIYRRFGNMRDVFLKEFEDMLESSNGDKIIFTGDFNLHVEKKEERKGYVRAFLNLIKSHGLVQHVEKSTHKNEGTLDLILSRPSDRLVENVRVGDYFSDHKSVECTISIEMKKEEIIESDDGQPDMSYAVNRKYVAEREANRVAENKKTAEKANKTEAVVTGKVKVGHVNAHSLRKKEEQLEQLIVQSKLNVVAVTETWFANDSDLNDACPKGFQALHKPRRGRGGGGVAIFCRDNIDITRNYNKSYKSFEHLDVSIAIGSSEKIRIVTIYRPSGSSRDEFLQEFESMLESSNGDKRIFTGDFNLHVEKPDKNDRDFLDLIKSHGLVQHVKESTHRKGGILDLILSRTSDRLVENVRVGDYFSDHKSVECTISIEIKRKEIIKREE
jgi:exonuclease III